ncbi:glycosyltransferase [Piscinibacter koreensis]|nr:glycosyltransferase [Schlegelella koreensis]
MFAVCVGSDDKFDAYARPSIERVIGPDAQLVASRGNRSIFTAYNAFLDAAAQHDGLEALVLLHEDVEIRDAAFADKIRELMRDPAIGLAGPIGASGVRSLRWWEGTIKGRCEEPRFALHYTHGVHDVDVLDGLMLVLSPWAVRNLRFDEHRFDGFHGYDADICLQARRAGKRVVVFDTDVFHHTKGGYGDEAAWQRADAAFRRKWRSFLRWTSMKLRVRKLLEAAG